MHLLTVTSGWRVKFLMREIQQVMLIFHVMSNYGIYDGCTFSSILLNVILNDRDNSFKADDFCF